MFFSHKAQDQRQKTPSKLPSLERDKYIPLSGKNIHTWTGCQ